MGEMFKHRIALVVVLLSVVLARCAHAFVDPPWITPTNPIAEQEVSVNIRAGRDNEGCDAVLFAFGYPQIRRDGNVVTLTVFGSRETNSEICSTYGTGADAIPVGSFAPGNYTVQVDYLYMGFSGLLVTERNGNLPLTIVPLTAPPLSTPAFSSWGLSILLLAIFDIARRFLRGAKLSLGDPVQD
jgi:hypothetical protein